MSCRRFDVANKLLPETATAADVNSSVYVFSYVSDFRWKLLKVSEERPLITHSFKLIPLLAGILDLYQHK